LVVNKLRGGLKNRSGQSTWFRRFAAKRHAGKKLLPFLNQASMIFRRNLGTLKLESVTIGHAWVLPRKVTITKDSTDESLMALARRPRSKHALLRSVTRSRNPHPTTNKKNCKNALAKLAGRCCCYPRRGMSEVEVKEPKTA